MILLGEVLPLRRSTIKLFLSSLCSVCKDCFLITYLLPQSSCIVNLPTLSGFNSSFYSHSGIRMLARIL